MVAAAAAFCQTTARLEFEVATVKASGPPAPGAPPVGVHLDGSQASMRFLSLTDYILTAYNVKKHQVSGPEWLATERYDIQGKVPDGIPSADVREKMREMLQVLLEERFKLKYHYETRELPVYALVVGKGGSKLKESPLDPEAAAAKTLDVVVNNSNRGTTVSLPGGASITYGFLVLEAKKVDMRGLVDNLARFVDRPVIDDTGLKGTYDFKLDFSVEELKSLMRTSGSDPNQLGGLPDQGTSIMTSLQTLGLKLEARKAPMQVFVVDSVEKTPTAN
jgi:uncharacterized protein (TIGR03435 family)